GMPGPAGFLHHLRDRPVLIDRIMARNLRLRCGKPVNSRFSRWHPGVMQKQDVRCQPSLPRPEIRTWENPAGERRIRAEMRSVLCWHEFSNGGPARQSDLLIGSVDGSELLGGKIDELGRHATRNEPIRMILGDELVILHLELVVARPRRR